MTEEQAAAAGIEYIKSNYAYANNGKALAADEPTGTAKIIARKKDGVVIGAHIVGGYATELLSGALVGINQKATVADFETMIFPHPTMSELVKEAVLATENMAIHTIKPKK